MKLMKPILDFRDTVNLTIKFLTIVGQNSGDVNSFWAIKHKEWHIKAIYDGNFYEENSKLLFIETLNKYGFSSFTGVSFLQCIHGGNFSPFNMVDIPATIDAIEEFRIHSIFDWCLLFSGDPDWAILVVHSLDFILVMGKTEIFNELYTNFSKDNLNGLLEMSNSEYLGENIRDFYRHLLYQIDVTYPHAEVGDIISISLPTSE